MPEQRKPGSRGVPPGLAARTLAVHLVAGVLIDKQPLEQVLAQCDRIQVKAAARLGINRNTLHKKVQEFERLDGTPQES